jgi:hypothetical protein
MVLSLKLRAYSAAFGRRPMKGNAPIHATFRRGENFVLGISLVEEACVPIPHAPSDRLRIISRGLGGNFRGVFTTKRVAASAAMHRLALPLSEHPFGHHWNLGLRLGREPGHQVDSVWSDLYQKPPVSQAANR